MPRKKYPEDNHELLEHMFNEYPGSRAAEYLKDGSCIQAIVEDEHYALEKINGTLYITEEALEYPDLVIEVNRKACEYLAGAKDLDDCVVRVKRCMDGARSGCSMDYEVNASVPRLLMKGYLEFAQKMGII